MVDIKGMERASLERVMVLVGVLRRLRKSGDVENNEG
jgi:hypothetical protein